MNEPHALIGDGIENPHNARALLDAAHMFGWSCRFRDRAGLAPALSVETTTLEAARDQHAPLMVLDTLEGARDIYGYRAPAGARLGLVVGNERRGVPRDTLAAADGVLRIPMASRRIRCLNVAAAAAVGLDALSRRTDGKQRASGSPGKRRPDLLLIGGADHVELGSTVRSAAAFGWDRLRIEDRRGVWFGCDRVTRSEGRAAARRGKNPIRLIPSQSDQEYAYDQACVLTRGAGSVSLQRANLARGPRQLIVLPDEAGGALEEDLSRLARVVRRVRIDLPREGFAYRYRLLAAIALAEVARQVGVRSVRGRRRPRPPTYDASLVLVPPAGESGELVEFEDLLRY